MLLLLHILPQPEVMAAMAEDGLMPAVFCKRSADGVYRWGSMIVGLVVGLVAIFVPFSVLWDSPSE